MTTPPLLDLSKVREFYSSSIDVYEHAEKVGVGNFLASVCTDVQTMLDYIELLQGEVSRLSK